jgi:hypothetical protein
MTFYSNRPEWKLQKSSIKQQWFDNIASRTEFQQREPHCCRIVITERFSINLKDLAELMSTFMDLTKIQFIVTENFIHHYLKIKLAPKSKFSKLELSMAKQHCLRMRNKVPKCLKIYGINHKQKL